MFLAHSIQCVLPTTYSNWLCPKIDYSHGKSENTKHQTLFSSGEYICFFFYIAMYSIYGKREEVDPLLSSIHFSILFPVLGVFDAGIFRCEDAL